MFKWLGLLLTCFSIMLWAGEDRGLGGTGKTANDDRGLGGTGVIGTITEFGSIWVNGLEIELNEETDILLDGEPAKESDLRLGQQVAVLAFQENEQWWAQSIQVQHALIGVVEAVTGSDQWTIQGVDIHSDQNLAHNLEPLRVGNTVKVSGYFVGDVLYATDFSLSESEEHWRVHGPVIAHDDGRLTIGSIELPEAMQTVEEGEWVTLIGDRKADLNKPFFIGRGSLPYIDQAEAFRFEKRDHERRSVEVIPAQYIRERRKEMRHFERRPSGAFQPRGGLPSRHERTDDTKQRVVAPPIGHFEKDRVRDERNESWDSYPDRSPPPAQPLASRDTLRDRDDPPHSRADRPDGPPPGEPPGGRGPDMPKPR